MTWLYVIGNSPILFTDAEGKQTAVLLSALHFDGQTIKSESWPSFSTLSFNRNRRFRTGWIGFDYEADPPSAGAFAPPAAGTLVLSGGSATAASAPAVAVAG